MKEIYGHLSLNVDGEVGQWIRETRTAQKISQSELARILGISQAAVSRFELGKSHLVAIPVPKIAQALKISPTKIIKMGRAA